MNNSRRSREAGFNLMSLLVGMTIVGIGAYMLHTTLRNFFTTQEQTAGKVKAVQVLSQVAAELHNFSVPRLETICTDESAFGVNVSGSCVQSGDLFDPSNQPTLSADDPPLEVRLSWDGTPEPGGMICVEVMRCDWRMENRILEVALNAHYKKGKQLLSKTLKFRRVRW